MSRQPILFACLALAFVPACGGKSSGKKGGSGPGATVGEDLPVANVCGTSLAKLTKQVPLTADSVAPDLTVGPAWIAHSSEDSTTFLYGAIKVSNKGSVGHCFVKASSISYRNENGQEVKNNSLTYIYGRVKVLSTVSTWTCLDPGESAYFQLIEQVSYFDVASINVGAFVYEEGGTPPLADLEATGISVTGDSVSIDVENVGTGSAKGATLSVYALNAAGEFQFWAFGYFANKDVWGPGERRTATSSLLYEAPCASLLIVPYYSAAEVSSPSSKEEFLADTEGVAAADALTAARLRQDQEAETAKYQLLHR